MNRLTSILITAATTFVGTFAFGSAGEIAHPGWLALGTACVATTAARFFEFVRTHPLC